MKNDTFKNHFNEQEKGFNLRLMLENYLRHTWWIIASVLLFLGAAYVYNRYAQPVYESQASILIQQDQPMGASPELGMLKDLGLTSGGGVLEDEIELYKSRTLMERVVSDLQLMWTFENIGTKTGIARAEFFNDAPIKLDYLESDSLIKNKMYELEIVIDSPNQYRIEKGPLVGKYAFGTIIKTAIGRIIISKSAVFKKDYVGKIIGIRLDPFDNVVASMKKQLTVEPASKEANIIVLRLKGKNRQKNNAVLDRLILAHQENTVNNKNQIVRNTTKFINERMKYIAVELSDVEKEGEQFKSKNHLIDVTTDAASYLGKESEIEQRVIETSIEKNLVDYMNDFLYEQQGYDNLLPANLGFKDESVVKMTTQYNELVLERNRLRETSGVKNPQVSRIESQLASIRTSLESSLRNLKNTLKLQLKKLSSEEAVYQSKIASIPQFEREYRDILRQQQIKETLYLFLLQKREENEISLAATVANTQVVDKAFSQEAPVSPKKKVIYIAAFLLGLLFPIGLIYVLDLLNNKVKERADLEKFGLSVLVELPFAKNEEELMVLNRPNSSIAEAFRVLRASLSFVLPQDNENGKIVSVNSTMGGEGKTFTSINLAYMYAATGKKVILVGLDLRKPRLKANLDLNATKGISNLIIDKSLHWKTCIASKAIGTTAIDVLISGDIPPNPSELLLSSRLDALMKELRENYDLIILDCAPVGLVVDALSVNRLVDASLYVARAGELDKRNLPRITQLKQEEKLKNMFFVVNGVKLQKGGYYQYGYGEDHKKSIWRRLGLKK